jgi:hypothetical protein
MFLKIGFHNNDNSCCLVRAEFVWSKNCVTLLSDLKYRSLKREYTISIFRLGFVTNNPDYEVRESLSRQI